MPKALTSVNSRKLQVPLHPTDRLLIAFWGLLSLVSLILYSRVQFWWAIVAGNIVATCVVCWLAYAAQSSDSKVLRWVHDWAAFPLVIFTYKQLYYIIGPIHGGRDYDHLMIMMDRFLFRADPTRWMARFANPFLTELLQISYSLFYVIFLAAGYELYRRRDHSQFRYFRFTIVYGFFLSYLGYFLLPSVGPRFTLHDFSRTDTELPGVLFTHYLRWFVNICESIQPGMSDSVARLSSQRDVFPSGHTMMTLVAIVFAYRYRLKMRGYILGLGVLLIVATVYLRYHYLVDILAGALLVLPCLLTSDKVYRLLKSEQPVS